MTSIATEAPSLTPTRPSRRTLRGRLGRRVLPYLLLAPSLALLAGFTYLPIVRVVWDSLRDRPLGRLASVFVGFGNYAGLLSDHAFMKAVVNNLIYAFGTVPLSMVLALLFALALQRSTRVNSMLRALVLFPSMVPLVAAASLFFFIFLPGVGLFDYYLGKIGVRGANWLGDPDIALWSLIGITVWKNAGYYMLFYLAGLQTLPGDVLEAATIDGANTWQRLRHVIVPLLAPTTAFVLVIALINVLTQVDHVIVLTKGGPSNSTKLVLYYIFEQAHENFAAGKAAAASVLSVAFLLAVSVVSLKTMERGAHAAS
ncbi:sugar ABC transporter permease [Reyranella sp.]|jgi:sn-glycerol 3-phosphate transport system permease protein|uniref:carbohydrate ABC transporter permease n=1 Tax=Reyranella sp. TaxID=1929291 RepID=UPI002F947145